VAVKSAAAVSEDADGSRSRVDLPNELDAGAEILAALAGHLRAGVVGVQDLHDQVRGHLRNRFIRPPTIGHPAPGRKRHVRAANRAVGQVQEALFARYRAQIAS
jgi:hypothetical protein